MKQLRRKINGRLYMVEAIRYTKEGAIHTRNAQKEAHFLARIIPLKEDKKKVFGIFVATNTHI